MSKKKIEDKIQPNNEANNEANNETILEKKTLIDLIIEMDNNSLSFFCGIFLNIPISLLLTIIPIGDKVSERIFFILWFFALFTSIGLVILIMQITSKKICIMKQIPDCEPEAVRRSRLRTAKERYKMYFSVRLLFATILVTLFLAECVCLWILKNFI